MILVSLIHSGKNGTNNRKIDVGTIKMFTHCAKKMTYETPNKSMPGSQLIIIIIIIIIILIIMTITSKAGTLLFLVRLLYSTT